MYSFVFYFKTTSYKFLEKAYLILQGDGSEVLALLLKADLFCEHILHPDTLLFLSSVLLKSQFLFNLLLVAVTSVE